MFRRRATSTRRHHRLGIERLEERTVMASWLGHIGGPGADTVQYSDPVLDSAGNSYISGRFSQTASFGPSTSLTSNGGHDGYLAKYAPDGALQWAIGYGGSESDYPHATDLDDAGQFIYAIGSFSGTADFGNGFVLPSDGSNSDKFILKVSAATGDTVWAKRIGGPGNEHRIPLFDGRLQQHGRF